MVVKHSKTKKTRQRRVQKNDSSLLSYLVLGGLVILGGAGWYHNTYETNNGDKHPEAVPQKLATTPIKKPAVIAKESTELANRPILKIPVPTTLQPIIPSLPVATQQNIPTSVPYKPDTNLPPKAKFAANNAANVIFTKVPTTVYLKADSRSKVVATIKSGLEMRSYEQIGAWHRIVVPSTDIIGWANEKDLSKKAPGLSNIIDRAMTGSINH